MQNPEIEVAGRLRRSLAAVGLAVAATLFPHSADAEPVRGNGTIEGVEILLACDGMGEGVHGFGIINNTGEALTGTITGVTADREVIISSTSGEFGPVGIAKGPNGFFGYEEVEDGVIFVDVNGRPGREVIQVDCEPDEELPTTTSSSTTTTTAAPTSSTTSTTIAPVGSNGGVVTPPSGENPVVDNGNNQSGNSSTTSTSTTSAPQQPAPSGGNPSSPASGEQSVNPGNGNENQADVNAVSSQNSVPGAQVAKAVEAKLAITGGGELGQIVVEGLGIVLFGSALVLAARRRQST